MSPGAIGGIAGGLAVPIVFMLLKRSGGFKWTPLSDRPLEELRSEYAKWGAFAVLPFFVAAPAIGAVIWFALTQISEWRAGLLPQGDYLLVPAPVSWAVPCVFLAILGAVPVMHYLYLALLGRGRYDEYLDYTNRRVGFDGYRAFLPLAILVGTVSLALAGLFLDSYTRVGPQSFVINTVFGFGEKQYAWEEIAAIERVDAFKAPAGNIVHKPHYVVRFADDFECNFRLTPSMPEINLQREIIEYLAEKTSLPVTVVSLRE